MAVRGVSLPDGRPLTFSGRAGDIWYVFIAWSVLPMIGGQFGWYSVPVTILLWWIFTVMVLKWFCAHASTADGSLKLSFEGGYLPYIGWNILLLLSVFTIVGGAWVMKYMLRWIAGHTPRTAGICLHRDGACHPMEGLDLRAAEHPDHPDSMDGALVHALDDLAGGGGAGDS